MNQCISLKEEKFCLLPVPVSRLSGGTKQKATPSQWFESTNLDHRHKIEVSAHEEGEKLKQIWLQSFLESSYVKTVKHRGCWLELHHSQPTLMNSMYSGNEGAGHPMGISTPGLPVHVLPAVLASTAILKKQGKKKKSQLPTSLVKDLTIVKDAGLTA